MKFLLVLKWQSKSVVDEVIRKRLETDFMLRVSRPIDCKIGVGQAFSGLEHHIIL